MQRIDGSVKNVHVLFLVFLLALPLFMAPCLSVRGVELIFIRADGTIEGTNKIHRSGNRYIFTGDIEESYGIIVEKNNIIIDGRGHTLKSTPRILPVGSWDFGIELSNKTSGNVTITNLRIVGFNIGVYIWTANNTVKGNTIVDGNVGVFLAESPNIVVGNHIENNVEGVFLGPLPDTHKQVYNIFYHNSFVNNTRQVYDCECTDPHTIQHLNIWDNGTVGNYWSKYNGTDADGDGVGDTPYQISDDDFDIHPLMAPIVSPLRDDKGFLGTNISTEQGLALTIGVVIAVSAAGYLRFKHKKSKTDRN